MYKRVSASLTEMTVLVMMSFNVGIALHNSNMVNKQVYYEAETLIARSHIVIAFER